MIDEYDSWRKYEDAKAFKNKLAEIDQLKDRIEKLEAALRNVTTTWDVWQKEKDSNSFTELFASICEAKALEGKPDKSVYKEGYRAVEEAMGCPSPEFWVERKYD